MSLPTARILTVYVEALTMLHVLCHGYPAGSLNTPLISQGRALETVPTVEMVGGMYISRTEEGVRVFPLPGSSPRVNQRSRPFDDLQEDCTMYSDILKMNAWLISDCFTEASLS